MTRRLLLISGKGGVGKTTLSCAIARHLAHQFPSQEILLLSTDPAHSLGDVLQMPVEDTPKMAADLPNLQVRALDADRLLQQFKLDYGSVLELLVERGSFVERGDLTPVWDLAWPGLDELMSILEIQRLLRTQQADRIVVDMAPSGHTLNLLGLMDFLDEFLGALSLFQEKHRVISQTFTGRYMPDPADEFLDSMRADLAQGRRLLQDAEQTASWAVAIAEPMSFLETQRFLQALQALQIPIGGVLVNQIEDESHGGDRGCSDRVFEQQQVLQDFVHLTPSVLTIPKQDTPPVGAIALDRVAQTIQPAHLATVVGASTICWPPKESPNLSDFLAEGKRLLVIGGKGGVGKTTVAAAIAYGMATQHPDRRVRVISIDPAHSLGDAFGLTLGHGPQDILPNLSAQEVDAQQTLDQFRTDYLWELAEMMSGDTHDGNTHDGTLQLAYGPEAWRKIVAQALPGIDEMLALITIVDLLETNQQDLIILDTAPTGHLLRFLQMPTAMGDWLAWIFKLWIKYQAVIGRTELMGRLRSLRQRVVKAQQRLQSAAHTDFIGVLQNQPPIVAETERLVRSLQDFGIAHRYLVHNRFDAAQPLSGDRFPEQTVVRLGQLPRSVSPLERIQGSADRLF